MVGLAICSLSFAITNWVITQINGAAEDNQPVSINTEPTSTEPKTSSKQTVPNTSQEPNNTQQQNQQSQQNQQTNQPSNSGNSTPSTTPAQNNQANTSQTTPTQNSQTNKSQITPKQTGQSSTSNTSNQSGGQQSSKKNTSQQKNAETAQALNKSVIELALPYGTTKEQAQNPTAAYAQAVKTTGITKGVDQEPYSEKQKECRRQGMSCGMFVGTVYRHSGIDPNMPNLSDKIYKYVKSSPNYERVTKNYQAGDIVLFMKDNEDAAKHVEILAEIDGKVYTAKAGVCHSFGYIYKKGIPAPKESTVKIYRRKS